MSNNKVTKEMLMEMMEVFLKEREYVSGSKMPTQKSKYLETPAHFRKIYYSNNVIAALKSLGQYCDVVMKKVDKKPFFSEKEITETFNRMIAVEYLHKFLLQISTGQETFSDTIKLGFGMENLLVNLLGGEIIDGEIDDIAISAKNDRKVPLSIKLLSINSLQNYGVRQSLSFVDNWLAKNKSIGNKRINYIIFEKFDKKDSIGVNCYHLKLTKDEIKEASEIAHLERNAKYAAASAAAKQKEEFETWQKERAQQDSELVKENKDIDVKVVFAYKDDLGEPFTTIALPKNIDKFLENNFLSIDKGINSLYKSLDDFKDSVTAWVQQAQGDAEKAKAQEALAELNKAAKII